MSAKGKDFVDDILIARHKKPDPVFVPSGDDQQGQEIKNSRIPENKNSRNPDKKKSRIPEKQDSRKQENKKKPERVNVNLNLEKEIVKRGRIKAAEEGRPFSRIIEAALEQYTKGR